jgi:chorismate lyase/3-hydroxybenzoate synthase
MHIDSLHRQADETFENLAALVANACGANYLAQERSRWLARYRELRVYVVRAASLPTIGAMIAQAFPSLSRVEIVQADLCRSELLVEIEGVAEGIAAR